MTCPSLYIGKAREELKVQLDYHLVHTEYKSSMWHQLLGQHHFRAENIADLMELIYFLWFEARQLTRAANMLSKVQHLLDAMNFTLQRSLYGISGSLQLVCMYISPDHILEQQHLCKKLHDALQVALYAHKCWVKVVLEHSLLHPGFATQMVWHSCSTALAWTAGYTPKPDTLVCRCPQLYLTALHPAAGTKVVG
jgi:hypothetical protein